MSTSRDVPDVAATRSHDQERDRGSVTAETAVVLPVLLVVLAVAVWVLAAVSGQLRCADAAGAGVRSAARGESTAAVQAVVAATAPDGAVAQVHRGPEQVEVVVTARVRPFGQLVRLPSVEVTGRAVALREDVDGAL